ncbi:MAG: hypothetical protein Q7U44_11835, partial [Desulfuromonadales bacterium]|nr:hypothetical protein [Desulfuromonadales bacterium]
TFASDIGALATAVEVQVVSAVVGGVVVENQALQDAIDDPAVVTVPVLPVGSVSLSAATISILDGANNPITSVSNLNNNFADLAVFATDFAKVNVSIEGQNSFSSVTENYSPTSFNLTVSDTLSNRSLQVIVSGVNVAVSDIGAVTLTFGVSPSLELRGINTDGSVVVQKTRSVGNLVTIIGGDVIQFDVNLLKAEIESTAGAVGTIGTYSVIATIIGAPGVPASVGLSLN